MKESFKSFWWVSPKDQALSLEDLIYTSAGSEGVAKEVADFVITYQQ